MDRSPPNVRELARDELALLAEVLTNRSARLHERLERQERGVFTHLIAWEDAGRSGTWGRLAGRSGLDDGYAAARHLYRSLGHVERPATTTSNRRAPWEPPRAGFVEILTNWFKTL